MRRRGRLPSRQIHILEIFCTFPCSPRLLMLLALIIYYHIFIWSWPILLLFYYSSSCNSPLHPSKWFFLPAHPSISLSSRSSVLLFWCFSFRRAERRGQQLYGSCGVTSWIIHSNRVIILFLSLGPVSVRFTSIHFSSERVALPGYSRRLKTTTCFEFHLHTSYRPEIFCCVVLCHTHYPCWPNKILVWVRKRIWGWS